MAKPIKETPILNGRDAINFFKQMTIAEKQRVSAERLAEIKERAASLRSKER